MMHRSIEYRQDVSGTNQTLQNFDFLAQTIDQMAEADGCDKVLLCELLKSYASHKQWEFREPIGLTAPPLKEERTDV